VPQGESPDERRAAQYAATVLGMAFEFTDLTGNVDYTSRDGSTSLEVTRYTNKQLKVDLVAAQRADFVLPLGGGHHWIVTFAGYPVFKGLVQRLYPALQGLETHGLVQYTDQMDWWLEHVPTLQDEIARLNRERVIDAQSQVPREEVANLVIMTTGEWTYGGPNAALELLEARVALDRNHSEKLGRQPTRRRHLWAWVDDQTDRGLARALGSEENRLPSRSPELPPEVDQIWVVDEVSGRGWLWDGTSWSFVQVP
jgi:hypothetical protein